MRTLIALSTITLLSIGTAALADEKPSEADAKKVQETLSAWGCEGGEIEKESEATGVFEIDDAKCKDGQQYDIKLDSDFNLRSITRD